MNCCDLEWAPLLALTLAAGGSGRILVHKIKFKRFGPSCGCSERRTDDRA